MRYDDIIENWVKKKKKVSYNFYLIFIIYFILLQFITGSTGFAG